MLRLQKADEILLYLMVGYWRHAQIRGCCFFSRQIGENMSGFFYCFIHYLPDFLWVDIIFHGVPKQIHFLIGHLKKEFFLGLFCGISI